MNERRSALPVLAMITVALAMLAGACSALLGVDFDAPHLATSGDLAADGGGGGGGGEGGGGGPPGSCIAKTCAGQGFVCGTQSDGCGGAIECGACSDGAPCVDGKCTCAAKTCPAVGASCGAADNGCAGALDCGTCSVAGEACVQNKCQCQPKNCTVRGATCGTVPDGCGNTYDCGSCAGNVAGPNCGGGGPNKCGATPCVPLTCAGHCGDMSDGCGAILKCAGCAAPQTCGGAGAANVCGCTPTSCPKQGKNCGAIGDGCGGTLDCGPCSGSNSCGGAGTPNVCGCTPSTTTCPAGQNCGSVPNGCGTNIACGAACAAPQTCGGGGLTNVCGCSPLTCDNFVCGQHADGCGGVLSCGSCTACFAAGTRITMADGSQKPIESVVAGDWVRTADPATGIFGKQQVVERTAHASELSLAGIVVVDGLLHATRNHPITANGKTVSMEQLQVGDVVTTSNGAGGTVATRIRNVTLVPGGVPTYDLVLADHSNHYFAEGVMIQQKVIP
jgi:hypothetical protein